MAAPAVVAELVGRFDSHREACHSGAYNEAQLREEFLDPLFEALGWDVYNKKGYAEAYKEVIHEAAIKVGGRTKAPDYCFRAGDGVPSFFVEAKKPSVDIRQDASPACQLRRYAWSAKLPVSILTDFEELAVYDCRIRPVKTDRASTARVMYRTYTEYLDCWDELAGLFSPEAIRRGALEKFIASKRIKNKKGNAQVDDAYLFTPHRGCFKAGQVPHQLSRGSLLRAFLVNSWCKGARPAINSSLVPPRNVATP